VVPNTIYSGLKYSSLECQTYVYMLMKLPSWKHSLT